MEQESREKQAPIEFRCRKILPGTAKNIGECSAEIRNMEPGLEDDSGKCYASPTPEKSDRTLSRKEMPLHDNSQSQDILSEKIVPKITLKSTELLEKFKTLTDLFDRMDTSIRLLDLRKRLSTFRNISTQVELLTKRKFTYRQLAQMKYVFPDAIRIEKMLVHDERTLCMLPDLKVNLVFDTMGCPYPGQSTSMALCQAFRTRLLELLNATHAEDAEIPEALLPEPFNQRNEIVYLDSLLPESSSELPQASVEDSLSNASHFSSSFHKPFCQKVIVPERERTELLASSASLFAIVEDDEAKTCKNFNMPSQKDSMSSPPVVRSLSEALCTSHSQLLEMTPLKGASSAHEPIAEHIDSPRSCIVPKSCDSTPSNVAQIMVDLMAETPAMQTPKRPMPTPVTNDKLVSEPNSVASVRRTLIYSPLKMDSSKSNLDFGSKELIQILKNTSNETMSSKRSICGHETNPTPDATAGINTHKLSQLSTEKRHAILDCLLVMFNTIHLIFESIECTFITKEELVHKIISNNLDIEDITEVEEQLGLLEELVPEWMCKKSTCNGEFLYCVKRVPDLNTIRARLSDALWN